MGDWFLVIQIEGRNNSHESWHLVIGGSVSGSRSSRQDFLSCQRSSLKVWYNQHAKSRSGTHFDQMSIWRWTYCQTILIQKPSDHRAQTINSHLQQDLLFARSLSGMWLCISDLAFLLPPNGDRTQAKIGTVACLEVVIHHRTEVA